MMHERMKTMCYTTTFTPIAPNALLNINVEK